MEAEAWRDESLEHRLSHALVKGIVDYIETDVEGSDVDGSMLMLRLQVHRALGVLLWRTSHYDEAQRNIEQALELAQRVGDKKLEGAVTGDLGAPNFGGGLLTAGGLYFTGASMDRYFRAFDTETGVEIWRTRTPYAGNAAPMSYRLRPDSKQYVVIAAGGNPLTGTGDALLAFAVAD